MPLKAMPPPEWLVTGIAGQPTPAPWTRPPAPQQGAQPRQPLAAPQ